MGVFKPTEDFKKCIENGENGDVRKTLCNLIFTDRSFSKETFDDALKYVKERIDDIYEEYNNKGLISDGKSSFTEDDFGEAVAKLKNNFCKKRIEDVKKISKEVYGNKKGESYNQSNNGSKKKEIVIVSNKEEKITPIHLAILAAGAIVTIAVIITLIKELKK